MVQFVGWEVRTVLGKEMVREKQDALTTELTAYPAVEQSGERNSKYKALIKTDRRSFGFLSR